MQRNVLDSNTSRPVPPANTGSALLNWISNASMRLMQLERRIDPFIRPAFDAVLRDPLARLTTALINRQRPNEGLKIAEERPLPDEESLAPVHHRHLHRRRCGDSGNRAASSAAETPRPTASCVRSSSSTMACRRSFATASTRNRKTYRAWVRFSGPGPYVTPDIDDVGFMSISIKLMGVPGPKLMEEEQFTQDMFGVSHADVRDAGHAGERAVAVDEPAERLDLLFPELPRPHVLDLIMQGLWTKTQSSPFEAPYFSCVPYLLGEGQAMQYSVWPKSNTQDADPAPAAASAGRLPAERHGRRARSRATSSSTFACNCRPIRI